MQGATDELSILAHIFDAQASGAAAPMQIEPSRAASSESELPDAMDAALVQMQLASAEQSGFNVIVDLCGVFKKTTTHEVGALRESVDSMA